MFGTRRSKLGGIDKKVLTKFPVLKKEISRIKKLLLWKIKPLVTDLVMVIWMIKLFHIWMMKPLVTDLVIRVGEKKTKTVILCSPGNFSL